jgi:hypothetical protein
MIPIWLSVLLSVLFYILSIGLVFGIGESSKNSIKKEMEYDDVTVINYQQPFSNNDNLIDNRRYASQYNQMNIHPHHHPPLPIHNNNHRPSSNPHNQGIHYKNHPSPSYNHNNRMNMGDVNINIYDDYCLTPNTSPTSYKPDPRYPNPLDNGGSHRKQKSIPPSNINYF